MGIVSWRYRERKNRREAWYNLTASMWNWAREAERGYYDLVPPPPHPDEYRLLPVLDMAVFHESHSFPEEEWDERIAGVRDAQQGVLQ